MFIFHSLVKKNRDYRFHHSTNRMSNFGRNLKLFCATIIYCTFLISYIITLRKRLRLFLKNLLTSPTILQSLNMSLKINKKRYIMQNLSNLLTMLYDRNQDFKVIFNRLIQYVLQGNTHLRNFSVVIHNIIWRLFFDLNILYFNLNINQSFIKTNSVFMIYIYIYIYFMEK